MQTEVIPAPAVSSVLRRLLVSRAAAAPTRWRSIRTRVASASTISRSPSGCSRHSAPAGRRADTRCGTFTEVDLAQPGARLDLPARITSIGLRGELVDHLESGALRGSQPRRLPRAGGQWCALVGQVSHKKVDRCGTAAGGWPRPAAITSSTRRQGAVSRVPSAARGLAAEVAPPGGGASTGPSRASSAR